MRAVCQRVREARVRVGRSVVGEIGPGLCILLSVAAADGEAEAARLAEKAARLRVFPDAEGRLGRSILDTGWAALAVSQLTLIANTAKGNRPSFAGAAPPERAEPLYERFCDELAAFGVPVARGVFGAKMELELVNDGPGHDHSRELVAAAPGAGAAAARRRRATPQWVTSFASELAFSCSWATEISASYSPC